MLVMTEILGFGDFNILFLKGTMMESKFILFSPWLLKSPGTLYSNPKALDLNNATLHAKHHQAGLGNLMILTTLSILVKVT